MKISDELQEQYDFLAQEYTVWVRGYPRNRNEACIVYRNLPKEHWYNTKFNIAIRVSDETYDWLSLWMYQKYSRSIIIWNDGGATDKYEVLARLSEAIEDRKLEESNGIQ